MKGVPIIIPVFNQLTYLKNLINWWKFYYPENPIYLIDNGSDYSPLVDFLYNYEYNNIHLCGFSENDCIGNLKTIVDNEIKGKYDYYVVSDPDIMPHPATPPNFIEIWKSYIDKGYHRVGFNLITDDLPEWLHEREMIICNEKELLRNPVESYQGHIGYKAPIDTTFAMYTTKNSGWHSPMNNRDWDNSLRIFDAFHMGWYVNGDHLNPEMEHYFKTAKYRVPGQPSAGSNNNRPKSFLPK